MCVGTFFKRGGSSSFNNGGKTIQRMSEEEVVKEITQYRDKVERQKILESYIWVAG